ncbi:DUF2066 domain-containing protein [Methylomonas koyamae]|uniref:DUF2066 domain-containing protein n=1 Tax=Methylomonas koyamae TaxID=702114 RepID=UPI002873DCD5|nr:DUF2066 domain-containing protein [Methylomonas koyamae]WNB77295.1 DUF2066 domain-containing protein [Methylomonas koyamae]
MSKVFTKRKSARLCVLVLGLLGAAITADAVEVKGLYEIELVARSQSAEDRLQAIKQAMYAVLSRVLVAEDISKIPAVQQALASAQNYVKQSQFSLISADEQPDNEARLIRVQFDEDQLMQVMRDSHVGIWSEIRPETLVWLVVDEDGVRQFYNADAMPEVESALAFAAKIKGIPMIYPMLDLEEQQKISVSEVLSADSRNLLAVSARYEVTSVMAGRIAKKGGCWQGEWAFYFDGKIKQWNSECLPLKAAAVAGAEGAYQVLSNYYGVKPSANQ